MTEELAKQIDALCRPTSGHDYTTGYNDCIKDAAAIARAWKPAVKPEWPYFQGLVNIAFRSAAKAKVKYPQPNYVTLKIAEEAGEVVRGAVHYAEGRMEWDEVQGEIVQLLAMLIRFVTEGDEVNGVIPPAHILSAITVAANPAPDPVVKPTDADLDRAALDRPVVRALLDAAKSVNYDNKHGNGLEGFRKNRDRLRAVIDQIESAIAKAEEAGKW